MTEKDIAKELVAMFQKIEVTLLSSHSNPTVLSGIMNDKAAKECAIIALNREYKARLEVIEQFGEEFLGADIEIQSIIFTKRAWIKIKEEITKL